MAGVTALCCAGLRFTEQMVLYGTRSLYIIGREAKNCPPLMELLMPDTLRDGVLLCVKTTGLNINI